MSQSLDNLQKQLDHTKSIQDFRSAIQSAVRRLWGGGEYFSFVDAMNFVLQRHLTIAWNEGAAICGIQPDELSDSEIAARERFINEQFSYLLNFADSIEDGSKLNGGLLSTHFTRAEMWINRYNDAINQSKLLVCKDQKLKWIYGDTQHCSDCNKLNGRVYRASVWDKYGVYPQSRSLSCKGYRCQCRLEPTTERANSGQPPRLRG